MDKVQYSLLFWPTLQPTPGKETINDVIAKRTDQQRKTDSV